MNRLQKKCFITSTGVHLLLVVILFVGPAFLSAPKKVDNVPELDIIPTKLVDALISGGGSPRAAPTLVAPAPPRAQPAPVDPPRAEPEPASRETVSTEVAKEHKKRPEISTKLVTRDSNTKKVPKKSDSDAQARQLADARRQAQEILKSTAADLRHGTAAPTEVGDFGKGAGGEAYASYAAWVKYVYENAWIVPDDATSDDAITKVSITIARDGTIVSSRIVKPSGDTQMDASVRRALDRVTTIGRPFPEGATDRERTYIIPFNMKSKQGRA